jgi:hypothetical protein
MNAMRQASLSAAEYCALWVGLLDRRWEGRGRDEGHVEPNLVQYALRYMHVEEVFGV